MLENTGSSYLLGHVDNSLTPTMDFSNLWKHCYRFTHASFHRVQNYTWLIGISRFIVSLHYLPRCLCSTVTCRAPIQWFKINPDCTPKEKHIHTIKTQKACVTNKNIWVCLFEMKRWSNTGLFIQSSSSSKFSSAPQTLTFGRPFCCARRFS